MNNEEFAKRVESVRTKLYKTALTYLGNETLAMDAVDETESREMQSSMRRILQQDGSVREKFSSELSGMLSTSLKAMEATTERLEQKVRKLTRISVAASMVASVLVCVVWHLLAG